MALARRQDEERRFPVAARHIDASEWRWVAAVSTVLLVLTLAPLAIAALRTPPGTVFTGYLVVGVDAFAYQALWRAGWQGAWFFHPLYSTEAAPRVLLYPWYLWSGHFAGWLPGSVLYHFSRIAAGVALLVLTYRLAAEFFRPRLRRRWAFLLAALGGGIGPLLGPEVRLGPLLLHPTEMNVSGSSVSDLLAMAPHLPWAAALLCWTYLAALRWARHRRRGDLAAGLAACLGLELIYPQLAVLGIGVIIAWGLLTRRRPAVFYGLVGGALVAPYLIYLLAVSLRAPIALSGVRFSFETGDPFSFVVLSHLIATSLIILAVVRGRLRGDLWLPALWILGMTGFMFLPGARAILGRSFLASSVPFGLLASAGLLCLLRTVRHGRWRRRVLALMLAGSSLFGAYSLAQPFWIAAWRLDARAEYEQAGEAALLNWIAPWTTRRDIILAAYLEGVFIPAQTNARAYVGHPDQTIDVSRKADQAVAFFDTWSPDERKQFLKSSGVDYVLTTDPARADRLRVDPSLSLLRSTGGASLFQVRP